jgi:hypothetical protein
MSITGISSSVLQSFLDSSFTPTATSSANQTTATGSSTLSTTPDTSTSGNTADTLTEDVVTLLKALANGDVSGAKADLAKLRADLATQNGSSAVTKDLATFLKDLASGNTTSAKSDLSQLQTDLQAEELSGKTGVDSTSQTQSPLDQLVAKLSQSLDSGSVESALKDVASYLIQQGQGTGSVVNTTA